MRGLVTLPALAIMAMALMAASAQAHPLGEEPARGALRGVYP